MRGDLAATGMDLDSDEGLVSGQAHVCRPPLHRSCCAFARRRRPFWTLLTLAFAWIQRHLFFFWVPETRPATKARRNETRRDQRLLGCELRWPSCERANERFSFRSVASTGGTVLMLRQQAGGGQEKARPTTMRPASKSKPAKQSAQIKALRSQSVSQSGQIGVRLNRF